MLEQYCRNSVTAVHVAAIARGRLWLSEIETGGAEPSFPRASG
jgi:hypothetical protein